MVDDVPTRGWDFAAAVDRVRERYPADGLSHFKLLEDNVRISWMHTRLFFGMLLRLPLLLWLTCGCLHC